MSTSTRNSHRTFRLVVNQLTVPVLELPRESYFLLFSLCCVRLCDGINRDVRYTVMILFVICQLMCVTDP